MCYRRALVLSPPILKSQRLWAKHDARYFTIPALTRQTQKDLCEFQAIQARATQWDPVLKQKQIEQSQRLWRCPKLRYTQTVLCDGKDQEGFFEECSLKSVCGAEKIAQELRTLAVLPEDLASNTSTHMAAYNCQFQRIRCSLKHACRQNTHT